MKGDEVSLLAHILIWVACALIASWCAVLARKSVVSRNIEYTDRALLSFPMRMALTSGLISVCQSLIVLRLGQHTDSESLWFAALPGMFLTPVTLVLMVVDTRWKLLPNRILFPVAILLLPLLSALAIDRGNWEALLRVWASALGAGILLFAASFFGLGMGDVKLGALLAAWLGLYSWLAPVIMLFLASLLGGAYALLTILLGKANLRSHIAFGPWLIAGAYLTWFLYLPTMLNP